MSVAILIAGMHRSGTSAASRLINLLGAELPSDLLPEIDGVNERGFWESISVMAIHDRFLSAIGSEWADYEAISPEHFLGEASEKAKFEIDAFLESNFKDSELFSIKDPRICRLIPLWLPVLEKRSISAKFIIPFRHPVEVSKSLLVRDGLGREAGHLLWLRYVLSAEKYSRGYQRCFLSYEKVLSDWRQEVKRISKDLSILWPRSLDDAANDIDAFLTKDLRHHRSSDENSAQENVPGLVLSTYEMINEHVKFTDSAILSKSDELLVKLDQACELFHGVSSAVSSKHKKTIKDLEIQLTNEKENAKSQIEYRQSLLYSQANRLAACEKELKNCSSGLLSYIHYKMQFMIKSIFSKSDKKSNDS